MEKGKPYFHIQRSPGTATLSKTVYKMSVTIRHYTNQGTITVILVNLFYK